MLPISDVNQFLRIDLTNIILSSLADVVTSNWLASRRHYISPFYRWVLESLHHCFSAISDVQTSFWIFLSIMSGRKLRSGTRKKRGKRQRKPKQRIGLRPKQEDKGPQIDFCEADRLGMQSQSDGCFKWICVSQHQCLSTLNLIIASNIIVTVG